MSIYVNVVNQRLSIASSFDNIISGSQEFVKFKFNLGDEWNGLMAFAQFRQNGTAYNQYLDDDDCAFLPAEIGAGTCTLMLYGSGGKTIATTNYLTLKVDSDILVSDAQSTEISQSLYNQLVAKIEAVTSWNGQSVTDLENKTADLQAQVNRKADATTLQTEIIRAKAAENANAAAIATKANQTQVDELETKITELASNEVIAQEIEKAVEAEMAEYLLSGQLAEMTIKDGSLTRAKVNSQFEETLKKADTAMQPSVYDPQGLKVDIYSYAQGRADIVQENLLAVTHEIADAYKLTDTVKYSKLGDAVRGAVEFSKTYAQALLADYKAFTIKIVDELPLAGESQTFYLIPKESGDGYDKYWYITNSVGEKQWDAFGASSTVVVETLPESGETDVDYILNSSTGCLYYKWIDNAWKMVAGSLAYVAATLPSVSDGNEFTDYYIANQSNGSYIHYRLINGEYRVIGGDSYTKAEIDAFLAAVKESVETNASDIQSNATNLQSLSQTLTSLQQEVRNLDVEGYTYYATYGKKEINGEEKDNVFTLYECKDGVEEVKSQFVIAGGGGGGTTTTTNLEVERVTQSPVIATTTDKVIIKINYSSTDADGEQVDGTYTWKMGNTVLSTGSLIQGENSFDMTDYATIGTQKFTLTVVDEGGSMVVKTWTVQVVDVRIDSAFSDKIIYDIGKSVNFTYTPYGSISKTVHFILDGVELDSVVTSASGTLQSYSLPAQTHGAHLLECYITATVNNMNIETDHIYKDIIWFDKESTTPVIGCIYRYDHYGKVKAKQYNSTNIPFYVFDPNTSSPTVTRREDNTVVSTQVMSGSSDTWAYKTSVTGDHTLTISCRSTTVTIIMDIEELGIDVSPITANLEFDFNPTGMSNSGANRLWSDSNTDVAMSVSDNFDWSNGGYHLDENGNQYFCVKAGTTATFSYKMFEQDASVHGAEFKCIFKTTNVKKADATFLTCMADSTPVGLSMGTHAAYLKSSIGELYIPYSEEDIIEFEFNINTLNTDNSDATALIMSYEDGVGLRPMLYDATHRLYQYAPVPITVGSPYCDVYIYRMKAYSSSLTDSNILANFIADAMDSDTMIDRYNRNQIYNENNALTPDSIAKACPQLRVIKIDCPHFTNDKKDYVKNTNVECIYKGGDAILDNWKFINCYHAGQGTTSNEYGYAGRNIDIIMCADGKNQIVSKIPLDTSYVTELVLGDGTRFSDGTGKVSLTRNSVPNNWFNIKVNIASSENANNALLQKRYNDYLPYKTVAMQNDPKCKNSMEFVNCVIFVRENDTDISQHREFTDTDWHFYAIGNIGDSKKTDATRVNDVNDIKEFVIEVSDNTLPNSSFQTGVTGTDGKMVYPITKAQWVAGNEKYDALYNNWDDSFEFRYDMGGETKDGATVSTSDEVKAAQRLRNKQIWRDFYEWVITSSDSDFVSQLDGWVIKDSALYWYLFTERYTMIDNRAKNTFWHFADIGSYHKVPNPSSTFMDMYYEKDGDNYTLTSDTSVQSNKTYYWKYAFELWDYDNDTALGINNSGELTMSYGKEDIDYKTDGDTSSGYIFNAAESVFWCRIRDLMYDELAKMYQTLDSSGCWSSTSLINEFDNWQAQFPEEVWRLDIERKYYRTYQGGGLNGGKTPEPTTRFLAQMMNGRKKYQRRQFERDQAAYMGTKYLSTTIKSDQIMFRCNTPQGVTVTPDYTLKIVPYSDMYLSVLFGNSPTTQQIRAKAGQEYEIECPLDTMDDTAILIYCASRIQALNDLSACYIHDNDFSKASKLQKLIIGNSTTGYTNSFLTTLNIGNNVLLEELDIRNCPNLVGSVNLSSCGNLVKFYAEGTAITGVLFASNGKIAIAHLPDTINSLTMKNLNYLTDLQVSYDNLESLTIENSPVIDEYDIVVDASDTLQTLRLVGIDWTLSDTTLLNTILKMNNTYLAGEVYISGQVRNQELVKYAAAWKDLEVTYDPQNLVPQHLVTFVNADDQNTVLYEMYVDQGSTPADPYATGLIEKPTLESDAQYTYSFGTEVDGVYQSGSGWDDITSVVLAPRTVTAVYTKTERTYTVTWYSRAGLSLGSKTAKYGSEVVYDGETPTNDSEEGTYIFNVFSGWDKSTGFITGDTDVYAVWSRAELPATTKDLKDMTPGEIFAVTSSGRTANYFTLKDYVDITLGHDFNFSNVESEVIATSEYFDGATARATNIQLFGDNEKSFTLAIDLQFTGTATNNTLLSCFEENGSEGFRIRFNGGYPTVQWGDQSINVGKGKNRDIVVLRHVKGENKLYVYASHNGDNFADAITRVESTRSRKTSTNTKLSLGGVYFSGDGGYDDYGTGMIHWCKIWYGDLGDAVARKLAAWCHEPLRMEFCGANRYRLAGNTSQKANASFIANNLLADRGHCMNTTNVNAGGWNGSLMRTFCNTRLKEALPTVWQSMLKKVKISASAGNQSTEILVSEDYVYLASTTEMNNSTDATLSSEGDYISWYTSDIMRAKFRGRIIPDDAQRYTDSSDPQTITSYTVKEGDIWRPNNSGTNYIFVTKTDIDRFGLTVYGTATSAGGWVSAYPWWLRSPYVGSSTYFWIVHYYGSCGSYSSAGNASGVCPCFSI